MKLDDACCGIVDKCHILLYVWAIWTKTYSNAFAQCELKFKKMYQTRDYETLELTKCYNPN